MDPKTALNVFTATGAAIMIGVVAYGEYQNRKLNKIMKAGIEDMKNTKFTLRVPAPSQD